MAPSLFPQIILTDGDSSAIKYWQIYTTIEVNINVAFVTYRISFLNTSTSKVSGMFCASTSNGRATVSSCDIYMNGSCFSTSVVDPLKTKFRDDKKMSQVGSNSGSDISTFDPKKFQMPFYEALPMSEIVIEFKYIQDMNFDHEDGFYQVFSPHLVLILILISPLPHH